MSVGAAQLIAEVKVTQDEEAKQKLNSVSGTVDKVASGFKSMLGNALSFAAGQVVFTAVGDAVGFLKSQLSDTLKLAEDHQQTMAQTTQAIKSTGDASGMSAKQLAELADSLSQVTEYSADNVQQTENLELTFTNIGKSVFPQATKAILDVSQAMGQDLKSSAIQVGKALGDPLTGMTALQRIGVTFSTTEKDQIKTMVAHNNVIGAQKVILKELTTEFGGSAVAAGKTFAGQQDIISHKFDLIKEKIGTAVLPMLSQFLSTVDKIGMPILQKFSDWFEKYGIPDIQNLAGEIQPLLGDIVTFGTNIANTAEKSGAFQSVFQMVKDVLPAVKEDIGLLGGAVEQLLPPTLDLIKNFSTWIDKSGILKDGLHLLGDGITTLSGFLAPLVQDLSNLFEWLSQNKPATEALENAVLVLGGAFVALKIYDQISGFAQMFSKLDTGAGIVSDLATAFKGKLGGAIGDFLSSNAPNLKKAIGDIGGNAKSAASNMSDIGANAKASAGDVTAASLVEEGDLDAVDGKVKSINADLIATGPAAAEGGAAAKVGLSGLLGTMSTLAGYATLLALPFFLVPNNKQAFAPDKKDQYQAPGGFWDIITHMGDIFDPKKLAQDFGQIMGKPTQDAKTLSDNLKNVRQNLDNLPKGPGVHAVDGDIVKLGQDITKLSKPTTIDFEAPNLDSIRNHVKALNTDLIDTNKPVSIKVDIPNYQSIYNHLMSLNGEISDMSGPININVNSGGSGSGGGHVRGHASGGFSPVGEPFIFNEQGPELGMAVPGGVQFWSNSQTQHMLGQNLLNQTPQQSGSERPIYLVMDGRMVGRGLMPHIAEQMRYNTNSRVA